MTGLAAEISYVGEGQEAVLAVRQAKHNLLRPETVESLFVLWRVTGRQLYRDWGWAIFEAFERHCRVPAGGYSGLKDVTVSPARHTGKMESFFTAETLKYLWLLFADSAFVPLDRWVFNTEAHPLRVRDEYRWGEEWGSMPDQMPPSSAEDPSHATGSAAAEVDELQQVRRRMRARAEALELVAAQSRHVQE